MQADTQNWKPDLATLIRRAVGTFVAQPAIGRIVAKLLRDRIPHRGLILDTSDPMITDQIKVALLIRGYESSEYRFAKRYLPVDVDVVELGASMGVISCTVAHHIAPGRQVISVEADPRIARILEGNLALNGCADKVEVVPKAIHYGESPTVSFGIGESTVAGRIDGGSAGLQQIEVPATTLGALVERVKGHRYALISDIEGLEWQVLGNDRAAVLNAAIVIMELHDSPEGKRWEDLAASLRADPELEVLDQHGSVVVFRAKGRPTS